MSLTLNNIFLIVIVDGWEIGRIYLHFNIFARADDRLVGELMAGSAAGGSFKAIKLN